MTEQKYRLHRPSKKNVLLQRLGKKGKWITIAFCGNNVRSIVRAISELPVDEWTPGEDDNLVTQLDDLRLAIEKFEVTIKEICQGTDD